MKPKYLPVGVFLSIIMFMMLSFCMFLAGKITNRIAPPKPSFNWEALYPFEDTKNEEKKMTSTPQFKIGTAELIKKVYAYIKRNCESYADGGMPGYRTIVETAKKYEELMRWNIAPFSEYNDAFKLKDGYLTNYTSKRDTTLNAVSTIEFADFCRSRGSEFVYANFPTKICISEDADISGVLDFANQNADQFLNMLKDAGVHCYDFRKLLHEDGMNHHRAFYVTDHHWKAETGLWAARHILEFLHDDFGWNTDPDILAPENFEFVTYPDRFLGSLGRKVTLAKSKPEDFTMIFPKFETLIRIDIPNNGFSRTGDLAAVAYNLQLLRSKDYYDNDLYYIYGLGGGVFSLDNLKNHNGKKILILRDSFATVVLPFLVLGTQSVTAVDFRGFNGSIRKYIDIEKPDIVMAAYFEVHLEDSAHITLKSGRSFYDFR